MNSEIERTLLHLEGGMISKDQAIGSLNTIFRIASEIKNDEYMQLISKITAHIRKVPNYFQLLNEFQSRLRTEPQATAL